ncbi:hypothetical protein VN12_26255 [Pirellula sp. SH-Sr6A]|uniref:hypothetical protein n=1 Tax=Pirellula sp. SH-Sr6A TaxID=1632865 RepID=UPI00078DD078|nr:hypothetical protein [Pirellula sp. SH-Sr6A]AMV35622.1 hypothetical protein VN12_26255 [Pirellula sp. SH-Sr6A]
MSNAYGYYSWVCFIDAQRGAWFGPIQQSEIQSYQAGFALDDNIKSFTLFAYYTERPTGSLTCNFSKALPVGDVVTPASTTFKECIANLENGRNASKAPGESFKVQADLDTADSTIESISSYTLEVRVSAAKTWQRTGVFVPAKTLVTINQSDISEKWITHPDKGPSNANGFGPVQGSNKYLLNSAKEGALIASIESSEKSTKAEIGARGEILAEHDGMLYLSANDELGDELGDGRNGFRDNRGSLRIQIRLA